MLLPKAITLDLDDTLWPIGPTIRRAEAKANDWLRAHAPEVLNQFDSTRRLRLREAIVAAYPERAHDLGWLRREQFAQMLEASGYPATRADEIYDVFIAARQDVELYPDALPALQILAAHYPMASVSNGNADLKRIGLDRYFKLTLSASDYGAAKPDPGIYLEACRRLGVAPEEVLHVGDDPHTDVIGARRAGLRTVWMNRASADWSASDETPDFVVTDLQGLVRRLLPDLDAGP
jgi:putative hydrolase of the HAD superfamily